MNTIKLTPKTRAGQNKINNVLAKNPTWSGEWQVLNVSDRVSFNPMSGPWWLIEPITHALNSESFMRWVHPNSDDNFTVETIDPE